VDLKTAQELLCHANSRITLDIYTRAISATKREANNRLMTMVLEAGKRKAPSAPSPAPSRVGLDFATFHTPLILFGLYGGDDGARTRDLCRDRVGFSTIFNNLQAAGGCQNTSKYAVAELKSGW
jgi:hypothetical protein